jgi:MFS superfamily sulfate permease-like transporter
MAVEFWLITSIWSYSEDIELCMVSIICFMVVMVAIIGGICASICGSNASS